MNITYIAPPSPGETLQAEAREINCTNRTALYDIKVVDTHTRLIAVCQALVYRTGKPIPFLEEESGKESNP
jgi:acyl-CoA thioesterase